MLNKCNSLHISMAVQGRCRTLADGRRESVAGLPSLIREGWRTVRETAFRDGKTILSLLGGGFGGGAVGFGIDRTD